MVFLDPPFGQGLLAEVCELLARHGWLAEDARLYMECEGGGLPPLPPGYQLLRSKRAGQVGYHLAAWSEASTPAVGTESTPALLR